MLLTVSGNCSFIVLLGGTSAGCRDAHHDMVCPDGRSKPSLSMDQPSVARLSVPSTSHVVRVPSTSYDYQLGPAVQFSSSDDYADASLQPAATPPFLFPAANPLHYLSRVLPTPYVPAPRACHNRRIRTSLRRYRFLLWAVVVLNCLCPRILSIRLNVLMRKLCYRMGWT